MGEQDLILEPKTPKSKRNITVPEFLLESIQEYVSQLYDYQPDERLFHLSTSS